MEKESPAEVTRDVSWVTMMGLLGGRLTAISAFLIILSFVLKQDGIAFYAFIAFAYIITIPYSLWMRNQERMQRLAPLQFLVDLVFVSGLIYFSGDMQNDFLILLYPLIILSAGIVLPLKQTMQITALAITSYALVVMLMSQNILVQYPPASVVRNLADTSGAMVLRACILLGRDEAELTGKTLASIHLKPSEIKNENIDLRGASDYFCRSDGSIFPVSIEDARIALPAEAVPHADASTGKLVDTRILNFNDISHFLRLQSQTHQLERIKAAAGMAKEMAHHIRTPLTGILGTVQLIQLNTKNDPSDKSSFAKERQELCRQIIMESLRLDKVVQNFLDYAEFSPQDIRELIQMDIDHEPKLH